MTSLLWQGLLVAAVAALLLIAAELGCRWWIRHRSRYHVWPPGTRLRVGQDLEVCPEMEPDVRFDINADGERGSEVRRNEPGLYRILVAGGSSVECLALDQPTSWPGAVERLLNVPDSLSVLGAQRVHVGNIGHSGVGAAELDTILERVLPQYGRLDAITLMVGASTVYHWLEHGAPPSQPSPVVPELALFSCHPRQRFGWKPRTSALFEVARRVRRLQSHPVQEKERPGAWIVNGRKMRAEAKELRVATPDPATMLDDFEQHYRRVLQRARAHAGRVVVVRQPWFEAPYTAEAAARFCHGAVGKPWKETVSVFYSLEAINRLLALVDARVAKVADELGVRHVNLRPLLTQGLRHYYDHDHFTPAGAAVVAQTVATALLGQTAVTGEQPEWPALAASSSR
jgi:lysophospholipase L1-like esterase